MTWAVAQDCANSGQKLVLLMLANYCNGHTGQCNPSHKRLAAECCMGVSTLKNHLLALEESGLIEIIRKFSDGVALPNQYMLKVGGVGQNLADGGSDSGWGVGQILATNQELKPVIEPKNTATPDGFAAFWSTWPANQRKGGKPDCLKIWASKKLENHSDEIVDHVKTMIESSDWKKEGGAYIPLPSTYLRQCRWDGAEASSPPRQNRFAGAI